MKFTKKQFYQLQYEDGIYDKKTGDLVFKIISQKIIDYDNEKDSAAIKYTVKEMATGKKYTATLGDSPWYLQDEENAKVQWEEVIPKPKKPKPDWGQIFDNNFDCYADNAKNIEIPAITRDKFIETLTKNNK